jgi:hypothetical protein
MVKRLRKSIECRSEHTEHIMQIVNKITIGSRLFGHPVDYIASNVRMTDKFDLQG